MKKLIKTNTLVHLAISDEEKRLLILAPGGKAETGTARKGSSHLQGQVQSLSKAHLAKVTTITFKNRYLCHYEQKETGLAGNSY